VSESLTIPSRFNGPLDSGNGGYCSGAFARYLDGPADVSLRSPVPLDTELDVDKEDGSIRVMDGESLVAEGHEIADVDAEVPAPVSSEEAHAAKTRYRGAPEGTFSRCFVCGLAREDSFGVFAGRVEGRDLVASPWTPPEWTADAGGRVLPEFVWAVLDCPTYFAAYMEGELPTSVLARLAARIDGSVLAGEEHTVISWPIGAEGRKRHAGAAVLSAGGEGLAAARALLIEPREAASAA
jgi:hypothetical protein